MGLFTMNNEEIFNIIYPSILKDATIKREDGTEIPVEIKLMGDKVEISHAISHKKDNEWCYTGKNITTYSSLNELKNIYSKQ